VRYQILLSPSAARDLRKLDRKIRPRVAPRIDGLADDPRPPGSEKLSGYDGLFRIRAGDYRIVYAIEDARVLVVVLKLGGRREIYERIRRSDLMFLRRLLNAP
jgi:mRNA interferase RelE/StbE